MPSPPTLANLENRLRNAEARASNLMYKVWMDPSSPYYHRPRSNPGFWAHTTLVTETIPNLKRQIANRRRRNAAKRHWGRARQHAKAHGIIRYLQMATMRPPNAGGAGYRRMLRQTNVGKKRTRSVGTSMSPNHSPKRRRSAGTSTSPPRRRSAGTSTTLNATEYHEAQLRRLGY